ncbi:MAG TPA: type II toxin-antitoxin system VapC family toxin [Sporichthyaceae bacterium]|jgi:hypothetical protein|nr:type II toxin-antitoxin system VapC family toxin [Sporichthyaceae bacterium]
MSGERATYLDSSAILKLVIAEPESGVLRTWLRRRRPWVSSALSRVEVHRALLPFGPVVVQRGLSVLARIELVRISDRLLEAAGELQPPELRSLDAVHLATALRLGEDLGRFVVYDARLAEAARLAGLTVIAPA